MAKQKSKVVAKSAATKKRKRRTDEELIRDLKEKIRAVKERQVTRVLKESPQIKAAAAALRSIDKALAAAADEGDTMLRHVLADTRKPLATHLEQNGYKVPRAQLPRGRRPKGSQAAE